MNLALDQFQKLIIFKLDQAPASGKNFNAINHFDTNNYFLGGGKYGLLAFIDKSNNEV